MDKKITIGLIVLIATTILVSGCLTANATGTSNLDANTIQNKDYGEITTFQKIQENVCIEDGKPIVYLFSTTTCPHCVWIKDTYDSTMKEYMDQGLIIAKHWELDKMDDILTPGSDEISNAEIEIIQSLNPNGSVPMYLFGCKYFRIGNGHERQKTTAELQLEEKEFRAVIEQLLKDVENNK